MPHVSRKPLSKSFEDEIINELAWVLTQIKDQKEMRTFLQDLLTPTEKTMLAKRLALSSLLFQGKSWFEICKILHISSATVNKMQIWLAMGGVGFKQAIARLNKNEKRINFWKKIDEFVPDISVLGKPESERRQELLYGKIPHKR